MIVAEYESGKVIVRIHDECINGVADKCLSELGHIVSNSYKRRKLECEPSVAAMQSVDANLQRLL